MKIDDPLVSIIITTFNRPDHLKKAIKKSLQQTYPNIEIFVVDHSGENYAEEIVKTYTEVDYVGSSEKLSQISAWNLGLKHVSGDFIQFHDDDDWLKPSKVEKQTNILKNNDNTGIVYCGFTSDQGNTVLPVDKSEEEITKDVLRQDLKGCQTTTMLIDSDIIEKIFPMYVFGNASDDALMLELCQITKFKNISESLVHRELSHESRGDSLANREKRTELIDHYENIYNEYPEIRREAIRETNRMLGLKLLDQKIWSIKAVKSFYAVIKYSDDPGIKEYNRFFSSFLGSPGFKVGEYLYHNYLSKI